MFRNTDIIILWIMTFWHWPITFYSLPIKWNVFVGLHVEDVFVLKLGLCDTCWGKNWIVVVIEKSKFISLLNHDASTSLKNQHFLFHVDRNSFFLINIDVCKKYSTFSFYCLMKKSVFKLIVNTRALKREFNLWQISILKTRR